MRWFGAVVAGRGVGLAHPHRTRIMDTFDISALETSDTGFVHLKNPSTEEPIVLGSGDDAKPVGITVHAPGTKAYVAAEDRRTNRQMLRNRRTKKITAENLREDNQLFFADVTVSFDNLSFKPAGEVTGKDLFSALYGDPKFGWVTDQVNAFLNDWGSFTTTSPTS